MSIIKIASAQVEYFVEGEGPALVLIHGTGGNAQTNWGHLVSRLTAHRKVIRPNYSGSGQTSDEGGLLSVSQLAQQVLGSADACGVEQFDLVGYSLGAAVAIHIAAAHPERVKRLVLLAGFASSDDTRLTFQFSLWQRLIQSDHQAAAALILLTGFSPTFISKLSDTLIAENVAGMVATNDWDGMLRQVALDLSVDVIAQAQKISCPTLSIGCTHDYMVAPMHARKLQQLIAGAQYIELSSGHLAPLEVPDLLVAALLHFLDLTEG